MFLLGLAFLNLKAVFKIVFIYSGVKRSKYAGKIIRDIMINIEAND